MIIRVIFIGLISLTFANCNSSSDLKVQHKPESSNPEVNNEDKSIDFKELVTNESRDTSETFVITDDCVYIIQMTSIESDSLENANPDVYEVLSENANNAAMNASELFDRLKIKSIWSDKRFINCEYNGTKYLLDTRSLYLAGEYCILFRKNRKPILMELELITEYILKGYFE